MTAPAWVDEIIAAAEVGATRLPLHQRRPVRETPTWSTGEPVPPSLARWLAYDAAWFSRKRAPFADIESGRLRTMSLAEHALTFLGRAPEPGVLEVPTGLSGTAVFVLRRDFARHVSEVLLVDGREEPPVLSLRSRRDPFGDELPGFTLGLAWPSFGAWLAAEAGLLERSRGPIATEVERELGALSLDRLVAGAPAPFELRRAKPLPRSAAKVPMPPETIPNKGFAELLREAVEGDDPARIAALCRSPKAVKACRALALIATIEGYERAAIGLLDFDPVAERAMFNAALNGRLEVLRACLDRGMDATAREGGRTPLEEAEANQQTRAAEMIRAHLASR